MNWLTHILAIYLLGLSLWPCSDDALPVMGLGNQSSVVTVADANSGLPADQHHHDQCSPFCTCSCCAAAVTTPPPFFSLPTQPAPMSRPAVVLTVAYPADLPAGLLFAIWQPPKHRV